MYSVYENNALMYRIRRDMSVLNDEFAVPVIIGNHIAIANRIYKSTKLRAHIFSERFSLREKLFFHCHKLTSSSDIILQYSIISFAQGLDIGLRPILILCDDKSRKLAESYADMIDATYITVSSDELSE